MTDALGGAEALRLVVRHVTEMGLQRGLLWQAATGLDRIDCLLLGVLLGGGMAHRPYREEDGRWNGLYADPALQRPLNVSAVGRSIGLSYETTRRRLRALAAAGIVAGGADEGLSVDRAFFDGLRATDVIATDASMLRATLVALAREGYATARMAVGRFPLAVPDDVQARILLDYVQRSLEAFLVQHKDLMSGVVTIGIITANVRHIVQNPELSRRYAAASEPPPDDLRQPITVRALARELNLPFETVRRKVADQIAREAAEMREDGVIIPTAILLRDDYSQANEAVLRHFERMVRDLVRWAD